jgi:ABC-type polysaccharide/polyol phosphate transport system ATPase subunit
VEDVIAFAELQEFPDLKLKNYSSGMQVRLAFSVMIQVDADVLLIDEVLAVGDAAFQQKCFAEFHRLKD